MAEDIRGRNVVAVIDFHETIIYLTDAAPGERPERLVATDPQRALSPSPPSRRESFRHVRRRQPDLLARTDRRPVACRGNSPARARQREGKRVASLGCLRRRTSQGRRGQGGGGCAGRHRSPWKRNRCSGLRSITSPGHPPEPLRVGRQRTKSGQDLERVSCEAPCSVRFDASGPFPLPPTHGGPHAGAPLTPLARRETRESATTSHQAVPRADRWPQSPRRAAHDAVSARGSPLSVLTAPGRAHRHHRH